MIFSHKVINDVLNFLLNNKNQAGSNDNFETMIQLVEAQFTITVDRLKGGLQITNPPNLQYPIGVIYEESTSYSQEELARPVKQYNFSVRCADSRSALTQIRNNLYAYRDAVTALVEKYPTMNIDYFSQVFMTNVKPPIIMYETGNYNGYIDCSFRVELF